MGFYAPYGSLCKPCPKYTYKDIPGYEVCTSCLNKPINAHYTNAVGLKSVNCPYQCEIKYGKVNNSSCEDMVQAYYEVLNGIYIPIIIVITLALIIAGRVMKTYLKKKLSIKEYNYMDLEKDLNSPEKIQA